MQVQWYYVTPRMRTRTCTQNLSTTQTWVSPSETRSYDIFGTSSFMEWSFSEEKPKSFQIPSMEERWNAAGILLMAGTSMLLTWNCEDREYCLPPILLLVENVKIHWFVCLCYNLSHVFLTVKELEKTEGKEEPQRGGWQEPESSHVRATSL